jgi:hypothetical protein
MKILILLLAITNLLISPLLIEENNIEVDTSEDILSEGISDPSYITEVK